VCFKWDISIMLKHINVFIINLMMYLRHVESNMPINEGNTLQNYCNQREKVICCVIF
jgi:hypothetical protein